MSGECEKCGDHALECECHYPKCTTCGSVLYRDDQWCTKCAIDDAIVLIEKSNKLLFEIRNDEF